MRVVTERGIIMETVLQFLTQYIARILLPLQVGDELQINKKNTCSIIKSMVY